MTPEEAVTYQRAQIESLTSAVLILIEALSDPLDISGGYGGARPSYTWMSLEKRQKALEKAAGCLKQAAEPIPEPPKQEEAKTDDRT